MSLAGRNLLVAPWMPYFQQVTKQQTVTVSQVQPVPSLNDFLAAVETAPPREPSYAFVLSIGEGDLAPLIVGRHDIDYV